MRKRVASLMAVLCCASIVVAPADPAAAACGSTGQFRAGIYPDNITVATGVSAVIRTPSPGDVANYDASRPTAADIYMWNKDNSGGFVQIGWYLGSAGGMPVATAPRLFWGENVPGGEQLHAGAQLSWGTYYQFAITNPLDGTNRFNVWLQNSIVTQTTYGHDITVPAFNGEVDNNCTRMYGLASHAQAPLRTLQYRYGTWKYFDGTPVSSPGFYSYQAGDEATDYAYGGGV